MNIGRFDHRGATSDPRPAVIQATRPHVAFQRQRSRMRRWRSALRCRPRRHRPGRVRRSERVVAQNHPPLQVHAGLEVLEVLVRHRPTGWQSFLFRSVSAPVVKDRELWDVERTWNRSTHLNSGVLLPELLLPEFDVSAVRLPDLHAEPSFRGRFHGAVFDPSQRHGCPPCRSTAMQHIALPNIVRMRASPPSR